MSHQQEAVREWAWNYGSEHPDQEWLISNYDTWEKNPHYTGKPGRHPEDHPDDEPLVLPPSPLTPPVIVDGDDIPF